jgi:hypothetical protein
MLGSFISHGLTEEEASSEAILQVYLPPPPLLPSPSLTKEISVAGSDTTATAIRATFLHIMTSPQTYSTLRNEIDTAIRENRISDPITDAEARGLRYLQAVIAEGLRIFPPVTGTMFKCVPEGGDVMYLLPISTSFEVNSNK